MGLLVLKTGWSVTPGLELLNAPTEHFICSLVWNCSMHKAVPDWVMDEEFCWGIEELKQCGGL